MLNDKPAEFSFNSFVAHQDGRAGIIGAYIHDMNGEAPSRPFAYKIEGNLSRLEENLTRTEAVSKPAARETACMTDPEQIRSFSTSTKFDM